MREIRQSGLEGGGPQLNAVSLPLSLSHFLLPFLLLGDLGSKYNVTLTSTYNFNDERLSLAANIGGTFDTTAGIATGGTADFINNYTYNALGQMASVTQTGQTGLSTNYADQSNGVSYKTASFSYDTVERLQGVDVDTDDSTDTGPSASSAYAYDADSNLTDLTYTTDTSTLAAYHWAYDADSRVTDEYSLNDAATVTTTTPVYNGWAHTEYGYDHDSQLTSSAYSNFANAPESLTTNASTSQSQTFDSNGNRTGTTDTSTPSGGGSTSTASASPAASTNRLLFDGTYYYTFDAEGNRTEKFKSSTGLLDSSATDITIYKWNNANELVSATHYATKVTYEEGTSDSEVDYADDPFGRMVSRDANDGGDVNEEYYVYDGNNVVLVLSPDGEVTGRELLWPGGEPDSGQRIGCVCGQRPASCRHGELTLDRQPRHGPRRRDVRSRYKHDQHCRPSCLRCFWHNHASVGSVDQPAAPASLVRRHAVGPRDRPLL